MANDALLLNPPNAAIAINTKGSDWLWAVFAVMLATDLGMTAWAFMIPKGRRTFHWLSIMVLTTASIAYFSLASDLGSTPVEVEFYDVPYTRQIWYARYIDWFITTPCLLLELVLATGLPLSDIFGLVFFDLVMIVTGLIGALVVSSYKWGYFAFGCAALFYIWWILLGPGLSSSASLGPEFKRSYVISAAYLSFIWLGYPIAWGLADGGNRITPDSEMIFYGTLDLLAKPVFCLWHVWSVSRLDYSRMLLSSGKFSEGVYGNTVSGAAGAVGLGPNNGAMTAAGIHEKNRRADGTAAPNDSHLTAAPAAAPRASEATAVGV